VIIRQEGTGMTDPAAALHQPIDPRALRAGDYVTVPGDGGSDFAVIKILATDTEGVHIRMYQERFPSRPLQVDPEMLTLGPMVPTEGVPLSVPHAPFRFETFSTWGAVLLARGTVGEHELKGYRFWLEAEGGYF
jgi:hypothetical protein